MIRGLIAGAPSLEITHDPQKVIHRQCLGITGVPQTLAPAESLGIILKKSGDHFGRVWGSWVIPHHSNQPQPFQFQWLAWERKSRPRASRPHPIPPPTAAVKR